MGAAQRDPQYPFSTMMAMAIFGLFKGAKEVNMEWSCPCGFCAVPVLPAIIRPSSLEALAVPDSNTSLMPATITSKCLGSMVVLLILVYCSSLMAMPSIALTRWGRIHHPRLATAATMLASCMGVTASSPCPMAKEITVGARHRSLWYTLLK